jgi:polysaccharide deacetylase 2 family uncharacterized protein YibQ
VPVNARGACLLPARVCYASTFLAVLLVFFAAACSKKPTTTVELREVTHQMVAAAQKVTGRRAEITIRPQMEALPNGRRGGLAADHIYVTLADAAQEAALEQDLDQVARRNGMTLAPRASGPGLIRLDYIKGGRLTHSIHIVMPVAAAPRQPLGGAGPRMAIILDDLGYDRGPAEALLALPFPLTVSVLPNHSYSTEIAEEAHRRGDEVLLHLPMESTSEGAQPEAGELRVGMTPEEVDRHIGEMLESVPHVAGVNNHQGSRATADPVLMNEVMAALRRRALFFVDSRTTAQTIAYDAAQRDGVRAVYRNAQFLDDTPTREAVLAQLSLAERQASRLGWAVAIGHPHPGTLAALEEALPQLQARGVRLVFASDLVR